MPVPPTLGQCQLVRLKPEVAIRSSMGCHRNSQVLCEPHCDRPNGSGVFDCCENTRVFICYRAVNSFA